MKRRRFRGELAQGVSGRCTFTVEIVTDDVTWWWSLTGHCPAPRPARRMGTVTLKDGTEAFLTAGPLDFGAGAANIRNGPEPSRDAVIAAALKFIDGWNRPDDPNQPLFVSTMQAKDPVYDPAP